MKSVPFEASKHAAYTRKAIPNVAFAENQKAIICETDDGEPVAVCVMEKWTRNSVWAHLAVQHPTALKNFPADVLGYIFVTCDRKMLFVSVPSDNIKSLKLVEHLGFSVYQVIPDYYEDGIDCIVLLLRREDCRFIKRNAA